MRLLVLGGTGFLGPHVVQAALGRGHELTLLHRGKRRAPPPGVESILGDRCTEGGLDALGTRAWDAVIDNCGYVPRVVGASARRLADRVERYLFVSSISVLAETATPGQDESAPVATLPAEEAGSEEITKHYGALKAECEAAVRSVLRERALCVRPGLIVGPLDPTDRFTRWLTVMDRGGEVVVPGDGTDPAQIIDVRDLAEWMVRAVESRLSGTFHATGPERVLTSREMLETCRAATGRDDVVLRWTPWAELEAQGLLPWRDLPALVPGTGETAGFARVDCSRALAAGLSFRPLLTTARDTLAWSRART